MLAQYWGTFIGLIERPFQDIALMWGVVPLYFALILNELTSPKADFRTAIQTGFSCLWAAAQWLYPIFGGRLVPSTLPNWPSLFAINVIVTLLVLTLGTVALISGFRRRYPKYCSFLGQTRFSNYFMITIYPIQAHVLVWSWERLVAIILFAVPIWLVLNFGLKPLRR